MRSANRELGLPDPLPTFPVWYIAKEKRTIWAGSCVVKAVFRDGSSLDNDPFNMFSLVTSNYENILSNEFVKMTQFLEALHVLYTGLENMHNFKSAGSVYFTINQDPTYLHTDDIRYIRFKCDGIFSTAYSDLTPDYLKSKGYDFSDHALNSLKSYAYDYKTTGRVV